MIEFCFFTGLIIAGPVVIIVGWAALHIMGWTLGSLGRILKGVTGF